MKEWLKKWPSWLYDAEKGQFTVISKIFLSVLLIVVFFFIIKLIEILLRKLFGLNKKGLAIDKSAKNFIIQFIKVLIWIFVAFLIINILGLDLSSFAGILSAITVALGLALQDIITGFASGLIVINQKHIKTDDYINIVDTSSGQSAEGIVDRISLMTTTLRTVNGQYITISNSNVRKGIVTNYTKNGKRRIFMTVPVSYESNPELVKKILLKIIESDERILKDPNPDVHYNELSDYSVKVAIKIWTSCENYWPVYNSLHEKILTQFYKNKIKIPTITNIKVENKSK